MIINKVYSVVKLTIHSIGFEFDGFSISNQNNNLIGLFTIPSLKSLQQVVREDNWVTVEAQIIWCLILNASFLGSNTLRIIITTSMNKFVRVKFLVVAYTGMIFDSKQEFKTITFKI